MPLLLTLGGIHSDSSAWPSSSLIFFAARVIQQASTKSGYRVGATRQRVGHDDQGGGVRLPGFAWWLRGEGTTTDQRHRSGPTSRSDRTNPGRGSPNWSLVKQSGRFWGMKSVARSEAR